MKKPEIHIFETPEAEFRAIAQLFFSIGEKEIIQKGHFSVVLSGGNSPKEFYQLLASDKNRKRLNWSKVFFFFGDERNVPQDDEDSNFLMAKNILFEPLNISKDHYFAVNTGLPPEKAAEDYWERINGFFKGKKAIFDFILLGLGGNSHTASLFPYSEILLEEKAAVNSVFIPEIEAFRISFTAPLINNAKNIVFLVFGQSKAEAVKHILEDPFSPEKFPAQLIKPTSGNLYLFLDEEAASLLQ